MKLQVTKLIGMLLVIVTLITHNGGSLVRQIFVIPHTTF